MVTGTYRLPEDTYARLLKLKFKKGIPISNMLRLALNDYLKKEEEDK